MTRLSDFDSGAYAEVEEWNYVHLQALRMGVRERIGEFAAERSSYELWREADPPRLVHNFVTEILGKTTGPREYAASKSATALVVGFASWWDMFKATYRGRWWMRWRKWTINYIERTATATATVRVEADLGVLFPGAQVPPGWCPDYLGEPSPVVLSVQVLR